MRAVTSSVASQFSHRHYSIAKPALKLPTRPGSRPSRMAAPPPADQRTNDQGRMVKNHIGAGLRKAELTRTSVFAQSGTYGESKKLLKLIDMRQKREKEALQVANFKKEIGLQRAKCLTICRFERRSVQNDAKRMEQMKANCTLRIKRVLSESGANELFWIKQNLNHVKRQLGESLPKMRTRLETEIGKISDKIHSLESDIRDAQRNELWKRTQTAFDLYAVDTRIQKRKFSDVTTEIARWLPDFQATYEGYTDQLSKLDSARDFGGGNRELMYQIRTLLLEILELGKLILREAHFARLYWRAGRLCNFDSSAIGCDLSYAHLKYAAGGYEQSARVLTHHTLGCNTNFWLCRSPGDSKLPAHKRPNRLTDLSKMIQRNALEIMESLQTFRFGVLSNDHAPDIQLRRAQAAALVPFWTAMDSQNDLLQDLWFFSTHSQLDFNSDFLRKCHSQLKYSKREVWALFDPFTVINWWSNKRHFPARVAFLKLPSRPEPPLSVIAPSELPGFRRHTHCSHNNHIGPQQESVPVFYCRSAGSAELVLRQLPHNGVISIDVRWGAMRDHSPGILPDSLGHDVSVVTVSTQSQVVVCHLAVDSRSTNHDANVPDSLRTLLEDTEIVKVGIEMVKLQQRFMRYLSIYMKGTLDVGSLNASLLSMSSAGRASRRRIDIKTSAKQWLDWDIPSSPRQGNSWLKPLSLSDLLGTVWEAYVCLRLFFRLSQSMLDLKPERPLPVQGCNNDTVQNLGILVRDAVAYFSEAAHTSASSIREYPSELFGPLLISRDYHSWGKVAKRWVGVLSRDTIEAQPQLSSMESSLQLYHLWQTLEWDCDDIEALLPQPQSNLPAMILEVIERGGLSSHPEPYESLQKMALVQLNTSRKLSCIEESTRHSRVQEWSRPILEQQIGNLMALVRAKIQAEKWLDAVVKNAKTEVDRKSQDLLPFAMWHIGCASVGNISRLLLRSESRIAEAILDGARRFSPGEQFSKEALRDVAQMTENEESWRKIIEQLIQKSAKIEAQPEEPVNIKITHAKKQKQKLPKTSPVVVSSPVVIGPTQVDTSLKITKIRPGSDTEKDLPTMKTKDEAGCFRSGSDIVTPFRASTDYSPILQIQRKMQRAPQACPTQSTSKSSLPKKIPHPLPKTPPSRATKGDFVYRKLDMRKKTPIISKRDTGPPRLPDTRFIISKTSSFKTEQTYSFAKSLTSSTIKDDVVTRGSEPGKQAVSTKKPDTAVTLRLSKISFTNIDFSPTEREQFYPSAKTPISHTTTKHDLNTRKVESNKQGPTAPKRPIKDPFSSIRNPQPSAQPPTSSQTPTRNQRLHTLRRSQ